jgi:hypothetical protein
VSLEDWLYLLISVVICSVELEHEAALDPVILSCSTHVLEYNNIMFLVASGRRFSGMSRVPDS